MERIPAPPAGEARQFLHTLRWFRGLDDAAVDEVLAEIEWLYLPGGEELCRQGEPGDGMVFVWRGRLVVVHAPEAGEERLVREVARGDSVGEISFLTGNPRTSTVCALRDSDLARLPAAAAERLLARHPSIAIELTRAIAGWIQPNARPPEAPRSTHFAIVAAGPAAALLPAFARALGEALAAFGAAAHVDAGRVEREVGPGTSGAATGDASGPALAGALPEWVHALEADHRFLLWEADGGGSPWTRTCLRQADRILVLAAADAPPDLGPLGGDLRRADRERAAPREELILLHREGSRRPRGTAAWLALRRFGAHHHVRLGEPADLARLARLLTGHGVGVVLGGGGARGLAHIGVLLALEEAGVPIDRLGGTSMGAVMAAQRARGYTPREMIELNRQGWVEMAPQKVLTLPMISLLSAEKAEVMLQIMYGDDRIEDLWTSFFCVSTNLTRTEIVVHREGPLRFAIGASMTIPGITPPKVLAGGDLLVDGGVLDNLPAGVMRRLGPGPVVAVDVSAKVDLSADPSYREPPSPWQVLRRRLSRRRPAPDFPNILQLIHRAALLASDVYAQRDKCEVELYLDLPMEGFEMFDMSALDRLVEHGYEHARRALADAPPELRARLGLAAS